MQLQPIRVESFFPVSEAAQKRAGAKLAHWLKETRNTKVWLAEQVGVSREQIHRWIQGKHQPRGEYASKICKITAGYVKSDDWF